MPVGGEGKEGPWFEERSDRRREEGRAGDLGKGGRPHDEETEVHVGDED